MRATLVRVESNAAITPKWCGQQLFALDVWPIHVPLTLAQHTPYAVMTPPETMLVNVHTKQLIRLYLAYEFPPTITGMSP